MPPDELDPAFSIYETPTEGMKRIERAMRPVQDGRIVSPAGASRQGNYSAGIGVQGPLSGMLMASSKPYTGELGAMIARGEMGPVSYQAVQPLVRGAPMSHTVGVGGRPFNADAYFGVNATRSPGGTQYGAEIRSGGFGAQGQYDPTTKGYSVGAGYQTNFAQGGRASVGHTSAAGQPVTLENHKGETRHRQDSGNSRMAADYGYLDQSRPDRDGMKTDAFVGPHHDSKKVFVINQQHPRTGKFNEHKVLLGYKDRAHAVRDYVHSFSDGLGHKRIHSIVEMGTHELKDWLKKPHDKVLKKAEGGPVNKADDPRQWLQFGGQDMETAPAGLPIGQALGTDVAYQTAEGLVDAAKLVQEVQAGEVDPTSDEGIKRALGAAMVAQTGGIGGAPARAGETVLGSGLVRKTAEREMSPVGLYSHGAEAASTLPQAKGAPDQMIAMLKKAGVKDAELEGVADAFAGQKSITRDELAQHFRENMPVVEERVLGTPSPEQMKGLRDEYARAEYGEDFSGLASEYKRRIDDLIMDRRSTTKFGKYTLPGGENYREVLLKAGEKENPKADAIYEKMAPFYKIPNGTFTPEFKALKAEYDALTARTDFRSSHWDDPNVLAHLRMSDRTGPNGEKILHVEEVQSDWGQKGKKEGFGFAPGERKASEDKVQKLALERNALRREGTPEALARADEIQKEINQIFDIGNKKLDGLPPAPYVTSTQGWTDLALKRALKEAAEGGYDKLVWTPGAEQAKRYDLSKHVSGVEYNKETGMLNAFDPSGRKVISQAYKPEELSGVIGKEVSEKLLNTPVNEYGTHFIGGQDLSVGGEGMKAYYDKILPKRLQELIKKHDPSAKIGSYDLVTKPGEKIADAAALGENSHLIEQGRFWDDARGENVRGYRVQTPDGQDLGVFEDLPDAHEALSQFLGSAKAPDQIVRTPGITITPAMRESILKGQTAFAEGGAVEAEPDVVEDANYAQGGSVTPAPQSFDLEPKVEGGGKLSNLVSSISQKAHERGLHQRKLSSVIKQTTGAPAEWSYGLAGHLLRNNDTFLSEHARKYPKFPEVIQAIDEAI